MKYLILLAFIIFTIGQSRAQIFKLNATFTSTGNAAVDQAINDEIQSIEDSINADLPNASPDRLMQGMANSSVMSGKGVASDYATNFNIFTVGASVGVGADLEKPQGSDSKVSGIGGQGAVVLGVNMAALPVSTFMGLDLKKMTMMFNFFTYDYNKKSTDNDIDAATKSFGVHASYKVIEGSGSKLFGWGGVRLHTGYEYNNTKVTFGSKINESVTGTTVGTGMAQGTLNGSITGTPEATIKVATHSIPFEVSTDIQMLYFLSMYTGLGADLNFGKAEGGGSLNGNPSTITCTGGACGGGTSINVAPTANIDATGKVNTFLARAFAGVQVNLPWFRIYGQVDKALGNQLIGAAVGARFAF